MLEQLGRYEIIEELGRGSMGVVYKARDPLLDRTLALKTVTLDLPVAEAQAFEQRFYREAQSAGRLNHPNIVTVHDVGKGDSIAYIAMEFLQGRSLREILDSGVVLPVERIVDIAAQVADGLAFAHACGVVHRDIKPPNIMVLDSGAVKITDFGIAQLQTGSRTLAGTVLGSPKYMSPEQVVGRPVDGRADIFSLGAVLYEMLTGFAPFFGGHLETVLYQVINEMPAPPASRNRALPAAFDYIVERALAKHPDDRYADAQTFAADLRGFRELRAPVGATPDRRTLERRAIRRRKGEQPSPQPASATVDTQPSAAVAAAGNATPAVGEGASSAMPPGPRRRAWRVAILAGVPVAIVFVAGAATWVRIIAGASAPAPREQTAAALEEPAAARAPTATATSIVDAPARSEAPEPAILAAAPPAAMAASASADERRRPERAALKPRGRLLLAVSPWGEIYVDGRRRGASPPLTELRLAAGRHTVEIRNSSFAPYAQTVELDTEATVKIKHKFR
ncbi:MAG TPA: serine/threonine-protein kinase [Casimicrobiaceae bacterium]|nr:serine/threonine-protein kinase [Casimicrobiaceae bacterium]